MPELLIILVVVLIIFGPKSLPKIGKSLGQTVKNVREGMEGDDEEPKQMEASSEPLIPEPMASATEAVSESSDTDTADVVFCSKCGAQNAADAAFCSKCGAKLA
jgi:sec-independent protein translocase protein TatA